MKLSKLPSVWVRSMIVVLAAAATAAGAVGCSAAGSASPGRPVLADPNVVVAAVPATGATGLYIAQEQGFFAAEGLHVTILSSISAADTIPDLLAGKINVSLGQWTSAIAVQAKGVHLRAIAAGNNGGPGLEVLATLPGSQITRVSELAGKRIAVNALDGLSQMIVENVLETAGVPTAKVHWVIQQFPLMGKELATHAADAVFMVEPYLTQAEEMLGVTQLADMDQGATQDFPITGYFATSSWASKNPATEAAFVTALERGQALAATDREAVEQALMGFLHISRQTAAVMALGTFPLGVDPVQIQRVADLMQANDLLPPTVNTTALVGGLTQN
jgi:NitT/TauT family transport system substrate-binding protein